MNYPAVPTFRDEVYKPSFWLVQNLSEKVVATLRGDSLRDSRSRSFGRNDRGVANFLFFKFFIVRMPPGA